MKKEPKKALTPQSGTAELSTAENTRIGELLQSAYSDNTQRAYRGDIEMFRTWAADTGAEYLPCTPEVLARYIVAIEGSYKAATIQRKVSAISKMHTTAGLESPAGNHRVREMLRGLRRERKTEIINQAPALRLQQIAELSQELIKQEAAKQLRDRAVLLVGFFGGFRRSELARLRWDDIERNENGFSVLVRFSKTDQEGDGMIKAIPYRPELASCPVRALEAWRNQNTGEYVFPSISKSGKISERPLSARDIDRIIKRYFGKAYSAHSLRAGFVTEAAAKGANAAQIARQTGHKHMPTVQRYTRFTDAWEGNAVLKL